MAERSSFTRLSIPKVERLVYRSAGQGELEPVDLPALGNGQALLKALYSGVSRGTESLVFSGKIPKSAWQTMQCPHQVGSFGFPVSYGYQMVAEVLEIDKNVSGIYPGDRCFLLHPHQSAIVCSASILNKIPENVPSRRATLSANMETALNAFWDSEYEPTRKAAIVGGGVVGLLIAGLCRKRSDLAVSLIEVDKNKRKIAEHFGLAFKTPEEVNEEFDLIFNTSASPAGLQWAINHSAFEATLVEVSWYGDQPVTLNLGAKFHSNRLKIVSSQVGSVSHTKRATMNHAQRMQRALQELSDDKYDELLEPDINFRDIPAALPGIFDPKNPILCQVIQYEQAS